MSKRSRLHFRDWKHRDQNRALKKVGERGAQEACAEKFNWGWCLLRAPRDLFCRPAETQWRSYGAARGHAFMADKSSKASIS